MNHIPYTPPYDRPGHGFRSAPETGVTCLICGEDIRWWEEAWELKNGYFCHAECVEKEDEQ